MTFAIRTPPRKVKNITTGYVYESPDHAASVYGISRYGIYACVYGKALLNGRYILCYLDGNNEQIETSRHKALHERLKLIPPVRRIKNLITGDIYANSKDFKEKMGIKISGTEYFEGRRAHKDNNVFCLIEDDGKEIRTALHDKLIDRIKNPTKKVLNITTSKRYNSAKEVCETENIPHTSLSKVLVGKAKKCYGKNGWCTFRYLTPEECT